MKETEINLEGLKLGEIYLDVAKLHMDDYEAARVGFGWNTQSHLSVIQESLDLARRDGTDVIQAYQRFKELRTGFKR